MYLGRKANLKPDFFITRQTLYKSLSTAAQPYEESRLKGHSGAD